MTSGAVKVGNAVSASWRIMPEGAAQLYVMVSPSGSDDAEPLSVTVVLSDADWSVPASAVGARLTCLTVTVTVSVSCRVPSVTLRVTT